MRLQRSGDRRTSERNVTLVQIQMQAQARNRRWHQFLCAKRDELHARLRQQGYSQVSHADSQLASAGRNATDPLNQTSRPSHESSNSWGSATGVATVATGVATVPTDEGNQVSSAGMETAEAPEASEIAEVDVADPGAPIWWEERDHNPL